MLSAISRCLQGGGSLPWFGGSVKAGQEKVGKLGVAKDYARKKSTLRTQGNAGESTLERKDI